VREGLIKLRGVERRGKKRWSGVVDWGSEREEWDDAGG